MTTGAPLASETAFRAVANPLAASLAVESAPVAEVLDFHRRLPGYEPTPLLSVPAMAARLGVRSLLFKCESERFGLPAFKMLGASWAVYRSLCERLGGDLESWEDVEELSAAVKGLLPFRLAAATDGNHGRAVARMAGLLGFSARIFVPAGTSAGRIAGIEKEGAEVVVVAGGYDLAVESSAGEEGPHCAVISDTSWPGYTAVPRWVIEGYSTLFAEIDQALASRRRQWPDVLVVPIGVGALAAAAVVHLASGIGRKRPTAILGVEPFGSACVTESALRGGIVTLEGEQHSIMAGLNCGTPSLVAWPLVSTGVAGFITIGDEWARRAVRELAAAGIEAGETGAAGLAGLDAMRLQPASSALELLLGEDSEVLVLVTEGASDREAWRQILGVEAVGPAS